MRKFYLRLGVALQVASVCCLISPAVVPDAKTKVLDSLDSGKPVVLIVARTATKADLDGEAYADWSSYLNDFASGNREHFTFISVKPAQTRQIFSASAPIKHGFAVIFLKNDHEAVYYDGMILDPDTYKYAADYLAGRESTVDKSARTLKPFAFKLIREKP
jgi:hypothetical protein